MDCVCEDADLRFLLSPIVRRFLEIWGRCIASVETDCRRLSTLAVNIFAQHTTFHRADVIKIEHPVRGDDTRAWGPPYAKYKEGSKEGPGESAYYLAVLHPS